MTHLQPSDIEARLSQYQGGETRYRGHLCVYTAGVKAMADMCCAHWLVSKLDACQLLPRLRAEPWQAWKLTLDPEGSGAAIEVTDGNERVLYREHIEYTDFPMGTIDVWVIDRVILLPSEY